MDGWMCVCGFLAGLGFVCGETERGEEMPACMYVRLMIDRWTKQLDTMMMMMTMISPWAHYANARSFFPVYLNKILLLFHFHSRPKCNIPMPRG